MDLDVTNNPNHDHDIHDFVPSLFIEEKPDWKWILQLEKEKIHLQLSLPSLHNDFLFTSDISRSTKPQTAKNNGNFACSTNGRVGKGFPCKGHVFNLLSPTGFWCVRTKHKRNMGLTTISLLKLHLVCHHPFLGNLRFWTNKLFLFNAVPPKKGRP